MLRRYWHTRDWEYEANATQDKSTLNTRTVMELDQRQLVEVYQAYKIYESIIGIKV